MTRAGDYEHREAILGSFNAMTSEMPRAHLLFAVFALLLLCGGSQARAQASKSGGRASESLAAVKEVPIGESAAQAAKHGDASREMLLRVAAERQSLSFVSAPGGSDALYIARGLNLSIRLSRTGLTVEDTAKHDPTQMLFEGANPEVRVEALEPSAAYSNYFIGSDASKWRSHVTAYNRIRYRDLYPGVDLVFYGETHHQLEYDLVISPGADPGQIRLKIPGGRQATLDSDGNLLLAGAGGGVSLLHPSVYQDIDNGKRFVAGSFMQLAANEFGFQLAGYDHTRPLVIDPTINLLYSTYVGGNHDERGLDISVDAAGNSYITGYTDSANFPVSSNGYQQTNRSANLGPTVVVLKFDASGTLLFSTFLGGSATTGQQGEGVRADKNGTVYVTGFTTSSDFPVTANALQTKLGGGKDVFFAALSSDGSQLIYSTFLGGASDEDAYRMVEDTPGNLWITGSALGAGLPVTPGVYQTKPNGAANGFLAKLGFNSTNTQPLQVQALTFLGGSSAATGEYSGTNINEPFTDGFEDIEFDQAGNVYVAGATTSSDFPATSNAYQRPASFTLTGSDTCLSNTPYSLPVIAELSSDLTTLKYATALSGKTGVLDKQSAFGWGIECRQYANTVHPDNNGNIWVLGYSAASDFPVSSNAMLAYPGNQSSNVTVTALTPGAQSTALTYSSFLGSVNGSDSPRAVWDPAGNIYITAMTGGAGWPGINPATTLTPAPTSYTFPPNQPTVTELSPTGTRLIFSTYLGGTKGTAYSGGNGSSGRSMPALDAQNNVRMTGSTSFTDYPLTSNAFETNFNDGYLASSDGDLIYSVLGAGTIGVLSTTTGGNAGDTTVVITGSGYGTGAYCTLVSGGVTITSTAATVNATGTSISCTFSLSGTALGSYDISIVNPNGGGTLTQPGGFTVQNATGPAVWTNIVGRSIVRFGVPSEYTITYGNTGDTDAVGVPVSITVPDGVTVSLVTPLGKVPVQPGLDPNTLPTVYDNNGIQTIPLLVSRIPAGGSGFVQVELTVPAGTASFEITASHAGPWATSVAGLEQAVPVLDQSRRAMSQLQAMQAPDLAHPEATAGINAGAAASCLADQVNLAFAVASGFNPPAAFAAKCAANVAGIGAGLVGLGANPPLGDGTGVVLGSGQLLAGLGQAAVNCAGAAAGLTPPGLAAEEALSLINLALQLAQTAHDCSQANKPQDPQDKGVMGASSDDPNYKAGPVGDASSKQYVAASKALTYSVGFENVATAALPAAQVVVTDLLDPTRMDLSTLTLGPITVGAKTVTPPPGVNNYNTTYAVSSTLNLRVQGSLDTNNGLLKWTFTSIDPSTGQPPTDPTVGFLPPDTDGIVGQGSAAFNVMPKAGQSTGTQINNTASVVFDANAPIATQTWLNTLDVTLPTSSMTALPATVSASGQTAVFPIAWSGSDTGSGVQSYTIYVSDNGGAFTVYNIYPATTVTDTFTGTAGHSYGFYSLASDGAGNLQAAKTSPDTSTAISSNLQPTTTTLSAAPNPATVGQTVMLTAAVASAGSSAPTGIVTFLDGGVSLGTGTLASSMVSLQTSSLTAASHSLTANYAGDTANAASVSSTVTEIVTANLVTTSTSLSVTPNPAVSGQSVTLDAKVSPATGNGVPTGTVTFTDGGVKVGSAALTNGAASLTVSTLATGSHSLVAAYSGDTGNAASISTIVPENVNALAATATTLTVSPSSAVIGTNVALTVKVSEVSANGVPTGSILLLDGSATLASVSLNAGTASYSTSGLSVGTHTLTASYAGDALNAASLSGESSVVIMPVTPPSFSVGLNPASGAVSTVGTVSTTVTVTPAGGFTGAITFACTGLPVNSSCSFSPTTLTPPGGAATTTLTIRTGVNLASNMQEHTPATPGDDWGKKGLVFAVGLMGLGLMRLRRRLTGPAMLLALLLSAALFSGTGCGGSSGVSRTPAGTSTIMVVSTSGSITQTVSYSLTVQ